MEMEEIVKMLIFVLVLIIMVGVLIMFKDKGGAVLDSLRHLMRFGK